MYVCINIPCFLPNLAISNIVTPFFSSRPSHSLITSSQALQNQKAGTFWEWIQSATEALSGDS